MKLYFVRLLAFVLVFAPLSMMGQKKKNKKTHAKVVTREKKESMSPIFERMLESTAQIMFIDSVVVDKNDFLKDIPLPEELGRLTHTGLGSEQKRGVIFENGWKNVRYIAVEDTTENLPLTISDKIGETWTKEKTLKEFSPTYENPNYPFLMADGITLLFAAKGSESMGGYDLFLTRKNMETQEFYKPENYGLPFNSMANDYLLVINETDTLGWLVTDRNQPEGKVCIYCFEPTPTRKLVYTEGMSKEELMGYATINSIQATWKFGDRANALKRLKRLTDGKKQMREELISFVINDHLVYRSTRQFRSKESVAMYERLIQRQKLLQQAEDQLNTYIKDLGVKNKVGRKNILEQEARIKQLTEEIEMLGKQIRNKENSIIKQ